MRPVDVDFRRQRQLPAAVGAGLLGLLLLAGAAQALLAIQASRQAGAARAQARLLQAVVPASPARLAEAPLYAEDAAAVARMAGFDWTRALAPMLNARVEGVTATSLAVDAQDGTGTLVVEASAPGALHAYESALRAGEPADIWRLRQWSTVREPALTATFELRPAGPAPAVPLGR